MQVSVVIPTYNRVKDLDKCLDSIIVQTTLPKEVIIVDDSDNDEIENLIAYRKNQFNENNILLRYISNERERSLTIARNIGVENATGDIIIFLDDDVIIDKDYIREILKVYKEYPNALGVQGYMPTTNFSKFRNTIKKILFYSHNETNKCRVLPSTYTTYPYLLNRIITCQWLSGSNQSYKKSVLENFRYDENLKRYSYKEDVDLSYRIYKQYPDSLYITPYARLIHKVSQEKRLPDKISIYMQQIYTFYFFYKNIAQNFKNKLIFLVSRIVSPIADIGASIPKSKSICVRFKYLIDAYIICMAHIKEIKRGDLEFFNRSLR